MVDSRSKGDFRRLKWVVRGEVDVQEEDTTLVDGPRGPQNGGHPFVEIVSLRASTLRRIKWVNEKTEMDGSTVNRTCSSAVDQV